MSVEDSVTAWLDKVKKGETGAPQEKLVQRFLQRLTLLARQRLRSLKAYEDENDVALSAMKSFLMRAPTNAFTELNDRNALWSLLAAITIRKSAEVQRRQFAAKRDIRRAESLDAMIAEPTNAFFDAVISEGNQLFDELDDDVTKLVARLRLEGYSNREIGQRIERSEKTVERKLSVIKKRLRAALELDE